LKHDENNASDEGKREIEDCKAVKGKSSELSAKDRKNDRILAHSETVQVPRRTKDLLRADQEESFDGFMVNRQRTKYASPAR
jgi:hypothetical protein